MTAPLTVTKILIRCKSCTIGYGTPRSTLQSQDCVLRPRWLGQATWQSFRFMHAPSCLNDYSSSSVKLHVWAHNTRSYYPRFYHFQLHYIVQALRDACSDLTVEPSMLTSSAINKSLVKLPNNIFPKWTCLWKQVKCFSDLPSSTENNEQIRHSLLRKPPMLTCSQLCM